MTLDNKTRNMKLKAFTNVLHSCQPSELEALLGQLRLPLCMCDQGGDRGHRARRLTILSHSGQSGTGGVGAGGLRHGPVVFWSSQTSEQIMVRQSPAPMCVILNMTSPKQKLRKN